MPIKIRRSLICKPWFKLRRFGFTYQNLFCRSGINIDKKPPVKIKINIFNSFPIHNKLPVCSKEFLWLQFFFKSLKRRFYYIALPIICICVNYSLFLDCLFNILKCVATFKLGLKININYVKNKILLRYRNVQVWKTKN